MTIHRNFFFFPLNILIEQFKELVTLHQSSNFTLNWSTKSKTRNQILSLNKKRVIKERIRIYSCIFQHLSPSPSTTKPSEPAISLLSFQALSQRCHFHLFFIPIHGHPHQLQAPGGPDTLIPLGCVVVNTACVSVTPSPCCVCQLSSPAACHSPHPPTD